MSMLDPAIVRIENLKAYLDQEGFEVVHGYWLKSEPYPVLFIRPKDEPQARPDLLLAPVCRCAHGLLAHGGHGQCLMVGCACKVYDPRKEQS